MEFVRRYGIDFQLTCVVMMMVLAWKMDVWSIAEFGRMKVLLGLRMLVIWYSSEKFENVQLGCGDLVEVFEVVYKT